MRMSQNEVDRGRLILNIMKLSARYGEFSYYCLQATESRVNFQAYVLVLNLYDMIQISVQLSEAI